MCGLLCRVCVRSFMPGRLDLIQPVFHVIMVRDVVLCMCVSTGDVWLWFIFLVLGWYPLMGCVHLINSSRIF